LSVDEDIYRAINHAAEAGDLNLENFLSRYNVQIPDGDIYFLWVLAEDASMRGGIIPGPDMKLTLQLIAHGGNVPAEVVSAVEFAYQCWKSRTNRDFSIADHITSGMGMNYISSREQVLIDSTLSDHFDMILRRTPDRAHELLQNTYKAAESFIEAKVWNEEGHDGSGYATWALDSLNEQKQEFLTTIDGLLQRKINISSRRDNENELNTTYRQLINFVRTHDIRGMNFSITKEGIQSTERLWLQYRDMFIELLQMIRPDIPKDNIRIWLNEQRIENFKSIMENYD
jgi:hypothetical protein